MIISANQQVQGFLEPMHRSIARGHEWLESIQAAAAERFAELQLPTTQDEDWRYTNLRPLTEHRFIAPVGGVGQWKPLLRELELPDDYAVRLVFVDGRYVPEASAVPASSRFLMVENLARAIEADRVQVQPALTRHAGYFDQPFTALNTACMSDGAFICVPPETIIEQSIQLVFLTTGADYVTHPRNLIVLEPGSQANVIEAYAGAANSYFTNAVTECVVGPSASLGLYKVQQDGPGAFHVALQHIHQQQDSRVNTHHTLLGGAITRQDVTAILDASGCDCSINGLFIGRGDRHQDNHLRVEHVKPNCQSREGFRGILADDSSGVFTGRIVVHPDAQKTDAKQSSRNLLLSETAQVTTRPQLEIYADDVKCTHGATVGQIDANAIFYLRSRGISEQVARNMLVYAFADESLEAVSDAALREVLQRRVWAELPSIVQTPDAGVEP